MAGIRRRAASVAAGFAGPHHQCRIAFNAITSHAKVDAESYGSDELMEHGQRHGRMEAFIDVRNALLGSLKGGAFVWYRVPVPLVPAASP